MMCQEQGQDVGENDFYILMRDIINFSLYET